jgi:hypothetical protein
MATAAFQKVVVVVLEMSQDEADWLRVAIQNPLHGTRPENEDVQSRKLREGIFNALNNPTVK